MLDSLVHDRLDDGRVQLLRGRAQGLRHSRNPRLLLTDNVGGTHGELRIKCTWRKPFLMNAQAGEQGAMCGMLWQLWEGEQVRGTAALTRFPVGKGPSSN